MEIVRLNIDDARTVWERGMEEAEFFEQNGPELRVLYPDQFIAVQRGTVIASDPDLTGIILRLHEMGVDPKEAWIRFVQVSCCNRIV